MGDKWGNRPLRPKPAYCRLTLQSLVRRASEGNADDRENLERFLTIHPEARAAVRELDDLAARAVAEWVEAAADGNPLAAEAVAAEAAALRAELLGPAPSALDRLLAVNLVVSHQANLHAARATAWPAGSPAAAAARDRRAESAQRRLVRAGKVWSQVRDKQAKGVAPPPTARLFAPDSDA
jgi:hypothetical protein